MSIFIIKGISQRDSENYYEFINATSDEIISNITEFFNAHIQNKFPSADFVVDIYRQNTVNIQFFLTIDFIESFYCYFF